MISYYAKLQLTIFSRYIREQGLPPIIGFILAPIAFFLLSFQLFHKTLLAPYIYAALAVFSILPLLSYRRVEFLTNIAKKSTYKLRLLETLAVGLPFILFLVYKGFPLVAFVVFVFAFISSFISPLGNTNLRIPTPYFHRPFEFIIGFRRYILLSVLSLFLLGMAYQSDNMNLGLFSILIQFAIILSYLGFIEPSTYIHAFKQTPTGFIFEKMKTVFLYTALTVLPLAGIQLYLFHASFIPLLFIISLGSFVLGFFVICKYANFPKPLNVGQTVLFVVSICVPILVIYTGPLFWKKSVARLNQLLK